MQLPERQVLPVVSTEDERPLQMYTDWSDSAGGGSMAVVVNPFKGDPFDF
jgi:hypothetical protein